jgi:hypothetical protein
MVDSAHTFSRLQPRHTLVSEIQQIRRLPSVQGLSLTDVVSHLQPGQTNDC